MPKHNQQQQHRLNQAAFSLNETGFGREPSGRHVVAWRTRWCRSCAARAQDAHILAPRTDGGSDGPGFGATPLARRPTGIDDSQQDQERGRESRDEQHGQVLEDPPSPGKYQLYDGGRRREGGAARGIA